MIRTALKFLRFDPPKSLGAMAGITISVFLVGQQVGVLIFLTNAMASLVQNNNEYIWVVDNRTTNVNALTALDMRIGREIGAIKGVADVNPIVIAGGAAKFADGSAGGVSLIGSEAPDFAGGPWAMHIGSEAAMLQDGAVITDFFDSKALGDSKPGDYFEINGQKVFIAAQTKGVRSFGGVYAFTTLERARSLGNFPSTQASAFLVEWDSGTPRDSVISRINRYIYGVRAWDADVFAGETISTVLAEGGIAFSIGSNIIFALLSGFVIIGLMLYTSAVDRIKDYGTLKAIGATNGYVRRLILTQAILLSIAGFGVAMLLVDGFRQGIANAGTIFSFSPAIIASFLGLTLVLAVGGSLFAIGRIVRLEPAQVFRG